MLKQEENQVSIGFLLQNAFYSPNNVGTADSLPSLGHSRVVFMSRRGVSLL